MEDNKTKKCKYCQSDIDSNAKVCPNCRKKQGIKGWQIALIVIVVIVVVFGLGSENEIEPVSSTNTTSNTGENRSVTATQEKFTVVDHSTSNDGYWTYVVGTIKNNTNKNYSYVQVEINLYDAEGNLVGSTLDNINNLEANGTWKFKAMATSEFSTYKVKDVTGW